VGTDTEIPLLITGTATSDDFQIGTLLLPGNATTATTTVQLTDDLLSETTETIVLALGGVAGVSRGATAQQVIQIADNDAAPRVYFSTTGGTVAEGDEPVTLAATLSEPAGRDVRVPLAFSGSATRNEDFSTPSTPVLTIPAGSLSGTFELHVQDDSQREMAETIIVQMQSPEGAELSTLLGQSTRTVITIPQNDAPEISLDSAYRVTSEDISSLYLNARLSSLSEGPVSVPYTVRGTAIDGEDFNILSGSLLFLPGSLEASIRVNITDDIIDEDIEYFAIELEDPDNAALGVSRTVVTDILDNDISTLSFATATVRAFEDESPQNVTVNLSKPLSQPLMVPLLVSGTASEGNDYTLSSTSVLFNPGDVSKTVQINLLDDALHESTEHLYLRFGDIGSIRLGNQQQTSLVIQDEDPLIHLRQVSYAARETDTQYQVFASLSAPSNEDVVVPLLYRGNATRGADYQGPSSIVIPAGETSANGSITIIDDELFEGDEQVRVYAQAASSGEYVGNTVLSTTIRDDDEPQRVFWSLANQTVAAIIVYRWLTTHITHP
jgi:hypothetical protein